MNKIKCLTLALLVCLLPSGIFANGQNEEATVEGPVKINLWHIWTTDTDAQKIALENAVAKFEKANPNIDIIMDATETEAFKTKTRVAIAANEAPDIFYGQGGGASAPFAESGNLLDLTPYYSEYSSRLPKAALGNAIYDGKISGVTFTTNLAVLYCNQELFDKYDLKLPKTYQDLITVSTVFRKNGVTPLSIGQQAMWPGMFHYATMAIREAGAELTLDALEGRKSFNQEPFIEAARKLAKLVEIGAFNEGASGLDYDQAMSLAQNGQAAMIYQGSWATSGFDASDIVNGKIVPMRWPTVAGGKGNNDLLGGAVDMWMGSANTKHPEVTAKVLFELSELFSLEGYQKGSFIPTWEASTVNASEVSDLFKNVMTLTKDVENYQMWWDTFLGGEKAQVMLNLIARIYLQDISPEEFALEMDEMLKQ